MSSGEVWRKWCDWSVRQWLDGDISLTMAKQAVEAGLGWILWTRDDHPYWEPAPPR